MKRETLLTIAVIVLFVLNLATLSIMIFQNDHPPGHGPGEGPDRLIIEGLHLNKAQIETFYKLREEHRMQMQQRDQVQRESQQQLWELLRTATPDTSKAAALADTFVLLEKEKKLITFEHFRKLRAICTPEQQTLFDQLIGEISRALMPPPRGPRK